MAQVTTRTTPSATNYNFTGGNDGIFADDFLGLGTRNPNRPSTDTISVASDGTTRQIYSPGASYTSNDPLRGSILEDLGFAIDPLGIFDVPQIQVDLERLNTDQLAALTEAQARRSWLASLGIEQEFSPETEALRREATAALLSDVRGGGSTMDPAIRARLMQDFGAPAQQLQMPELERSQLLDQASAQVLAELGLGGQLDAETRNLVMREAAQRGSGSGFLGGVIGRDIGARDLGLTSMNLQQQRLGQALNVGQMQQAQNVQQQGLKNALNQANASLQQQGVQNRMGIGGFFNNQGQQEFTNRMGLAGFGQGIERPMGSIDPGALASAYIADINQRNQIVNQANIAQGQIAQGAKEGQNALIGDVVGGMMGMFCWVAREVYGEETDKWTEFRFWLISVAPEWLYKWYGKNGERLAAWLKNNNGATGRLARYTIRKLMDRVIKKTEKSYGC